MWRSGLHDHGPSYEGPGEGRETNGGGMGDARGANGPVRRGGRAQARERRGCARGWE